MLRDLSGVQRTNSIPYECVEAVKSDIGRLHDVRILWLFVSMSF